MNLFHTQGQTEEFGTTQEIERELAIHRSFLDNQEKDAVIDNIKTSVCGSPLMVAWCTLQLWPARRETTSLM